MIIKGILENVSVNGHERNARLKANDRQFYFSYSDPENYMDLDDPEKFALGQEVSYPVKLTYVTGYENAKLAEKLEIVHTNPPAFTTVAVGEVRKKINPRCYLFDVGAEEELLVEFEKKTELPVGAKIKVRGELMVHQADEEDSEI